MSDESSVQPVEPTSDSVSPNVDTTTASAAVAEPAAAEQAPSSIEQKSETPDFDGEIEDNFDDGEEDPEENEHIIESALQEIPDTRDHLNIIFIGHVDSGKSTTAGNLLFQTGVIDQRTIEKYEREAKEKNRGSWLYAYIMDTNEEERQKGKTVEVGRAYFETSKKRYTILDAPGHKNYVPNMIGGVAQADIGILIISSKKGEFESGFEKGGQTKEHATLAKTLGVKQLIIAINKMDESGWAEERYNECIEKLTPFIKSVGFNLKNDIFWIPISGFTGDNIKVRISKETCPWYSGPSLLELLDDIKPPNRDENGPVRIPLLTKYKDKGATVVLGKLESGTLSKGQRVIIIPGKVKSDVAFIELNDVEMKICKPGANICVGLNEAKESDIKQGFILCDVEHPVRTATKFKAQMVLLDLLPHKCIFSAGYEAVIHIHTCVEEISVAELVNVLNKKTKKLMPKPTFVKKGDVIECIIETAQPIALETFDTLQQLGRFTLRDEGKTIAVGKVLEIIG